MHWDGAAVPKPQKRIKPGRETGNPHKDASVVQEKQAAADITKATGIKMIRQPMSGAIREKPSDVRSDKRIRNPLEKLAIEAKVVGDVTSRGETIIPLKLEWLDKILQEAVEENSIPMLLVQFRGDDRRFVTMRFEDVVRLLAENKQLTDALGD